ncbi:universal stress protein [Rathayibacter sp. VKM Ac-2759]|uniref:universal stress protein n=1 Tax=Rathayibacter sp. VKM Ac-2759 TaxID=2609252 RepID=UPI001318DBC1|nr:universal stress protein [Rathayibacter sp. VKM Ac-2759]QHC66672.1 universal stress protein [Rathayibacter sp. VKM Ac-2759]
MTPHLLVGVDGSSPSRAAARWAGERAAALGRGVLLLHVLDDEWGGVGHDVAEDLQRRAEATLEEERGRLLALHPGLAVEVRSVHGNPMDELAECSRSAAMVVVGTHRTGFVRGRVVGSRSLQLAAAADVPVAVVPELLGRHRHGVVVGLDESAASRAALEFALDECLRARGELTLLRAEPRDAPSGDLVSDPVLLAAVATARAELPDGVFLRARLTRRDPAESLLDAGRGADILVVGSSRRVGAARWTLGHVSHDVLLNLTGPTVVVHAPQ